ncbi:MAG: hypothetical protein A3D95_10745 [Betaproteobacteria bacterium RIFCSPHIGHO2_12_FULL_69_13]|nr:MAG: hypothetical protein A3D95_10745 [Betaproteobacteria bacterium RIFCSPHIGHO2_12_FULL_69_13]OGA64917.1 MAG: hypothetical protein A3G83_03230 [Betaproteobacteria bacterium RIFCSPLOWO2_12_FULL_68_20]
MGDIAVGPAKLISMKAIDRLESFLAAKRVHELKPAHGPGRLQLSPLRVRRKEVNQSGKTD